MPTSRRGQSISARAKIPSHLKRKIIYTFPVMPEAPTHFELIYWTDTHYDGVVSKSTGQPSREVPCVEIVHDYVQKIISLISHKTSGPWGEANKLDMRWSTNFLLTLKLLEEALKAV